MSFKTPAEQQLEFLKKLKEQKDGTKRPAPSAHPAVKKEASAAPAPLSLKPAPDSNRRKKPQRALVMSEEVWQRFKKEALESGKYRQGKALGDWAAALLMHLPAGLAEAPADAQRELFEKLSEWCVSRGIK
jgi:hypothetical protein